MRGVRFNKEQTRFELADVNIEPRPETVAVELKAASLNHRDLWMEKGLYPKVADGAIGGSCGAGLYQGEAVMINPNFQWGADPAYPDHSQYEILGGHLHGTFTEVIHVNEDRVVQAPQHLSMEEAAAFPLAGLTAYRSLFGKGEATKDKKILISGIGGGVALMAFQFAVAIGAEVFVTSSSEKKIEKAMALGAAGAGNYTYEQWHKSFIKEHGRVDLVIDSAGGKGFQSLMKVCNPKAKICMYGGTRGMAAMNPQLLFWNELEIYGSTMGSDHEFKQMVELVEKYKIKPAIDSVFTIEDFRKAFDRMDNGEQFGKIVLQTS